VRSASIVSKSGEIEKCVAARSSALKRLEKFIGTWDMKGRTLGADVDNVSGRAESLELVGYDPETNTFPSTVFDRTP
jgi:hypothetical protein